MLNPTQRSILNLIGLHWEDFYRVFEENGLCKAELRSDPSVLLVAENPIDLENALKEDRASRHQEPEQRYRWVESCSGPPHKVVDPAPPLRFRNSG